MRYLIDGYNLMHAIGLVRKGGGQAAWEQSREQLLHWLADQLGPNTQTVTVVFDAQNTKRLTPQQTVRGLRVRMALGTTADDVIEQLIEHERSPQTLSIVSNDQRIRLAARQAGCALLTCREYVDSVLTPPRSTPKTTDEPEKPTTLSDKERDEWLLLFSEQK